MFFSKKKEPKKAQRKQKPAAPKEEPKLSETQAPDAPKPPEAGEVRERLQQGWLRVFVVFEIAGKPREHVETTLHAYMANIRNESRILPIKEDYAEPLAHEDGIFSAFVEVETLVQDLETLTWLAINFMPASIEVLEPENVQLEGRNVTNWFNDLLAKLHETANVLREERSVNAHLTEAMNALIKNALLASISGGERSTQELERAVGIKVEQLAPFLKHLVEKGQLAQRGTKYALP